MKKKIKVAIVGSNFGLKCYLPVVKKINKLDLKVICSRNIDQIKKNFKDIKNLDCIDNWKEIFKKNIDILICAVPPKVQEKILIYNLKFKKKIIFEKPISSNLKKSIKLVENLKKNKINCEVNLTYLFHPLFNKVKNIIDKKALGNVNDFDINWSFTSYDFNKKIRSWKTLESDGGGIKNIFLTHVFSYCQFFFGQIKLKNYDCEKVTFKRIVYKKKINCQLSTLKDIKGNIFISTKKKGFQDHNIKIFFENGYINLRNNSSDWTRNFILKIFYKKTNKFRYFKNPSFKKFKDGRSELIYFLFTKFLKKSNYNNLHYCLNAEKINNKIN